jgi:hypothetical protein
MTDFERETYQFIKKRGVLLMKMVPPRMKGAIPNLKTKGFVEIFKQYTFYGAKKKHKFVKTKEDTDS